MRSREELQTKLEGRKAKLELYLNTDAGIVEQYEKRKRDVSGPQTHSRFSISCCLYSQVEKLKKTIAERQKTDKVEHIITNARVRSARCL